VISIFFSLLALARAAFGWNWTPDLWLRGNLVTAVVLPPGVMSILTATALLLLAGALLLQLPPLERQRHAPGIGAGLAVLVLGIGLTNFLGYAAGTPFVFAGQRIQMAFLTAVCLMLFGTGVLLNGPAASWCVALLAGEVPAATGTHRRWFQRSTYVLFLPVLTLSVAVVAVGVIFLRHRQSATRESAGVMLSAIAEAKVAQIVQWRRERLEDAETALAYSTIVRRYVRLASRPADGTVPGFVRRELKAWQQHSQYARVRLLSPDGTVRFAPPPGGQVVEPSLAPLIAQSSRSDRILLSDLYATPALPSGAAMAMVVPLRLEAEQAGADELSVGAMLFEIDPASFLFPFVQAWPLRGRTAEAILFRLEAEEGLVLNPLRQQPEAALKLRLSLNRLNMLGDPEEGDAVEGIDHRGVAVLTTMRRVPGSPWFLLCKVDLAEIYAPLRFGAMITALLVGLLWLAGVIAAGLLWRQQRVRLLQHSLAQEREQLALAERVVHLTKHANDAILLTDGEWRLLEANDRALQLYGFSLEEIRRLTLSHLLAPGAREDFGRKIDQLAATGGAIIESLHRRKDESTFPVENSVRAIDLGGVRFHQCIVRDVSERQQAEHALRQSRALLQAVIEGTSDAIYVKDVAGRYLLFNSAAARFLGNPDGEIAGQTDLALFPPADARRMMEADRGVLESDRLQTLEEEVTLDGKPHVFLSTKGPLRDAEGRVTGLFGIARDITALKQSARQTAELLRETERARAALLGILEDQRAAEEALRMSEERFRIIFEQAPLGVALIDSLTGRFLALNSRYAQIAGRTVEELLARDWMAITHPDDIRPEQESMEAMLSGRTTGFST
ncbi:MAG: PAS domain S-box protein, partial [Verrucomicrobia bacterium]|nr:PAS domain S-box protein [Verrucomicrobiota bacterium]